MNKLKTIVLSLALACGLGASARSGADSLQLVVGKGRLTLNFLMDNAVRVRYEEGRGETLPDWVYVTRDHTKYKLEQRKGGVVLTTSAMKVDVADNGLLTVADKKGHVVLRTTGFALTPSTVAGEPTHVAELRMASPADEYLYGLGQFQDGFTNVRGLTRRLTQVNTQISIPMFVSNKGYGVLWNNYGLTDFNPSEHIVAMTRTEESAHADTVSVTSTSGTRREVRKANRFAADIVVDKAGRYALLLDVGQKMARRHHLRIDGRTVLEMDNLWLPPTASTIVDLGAGEHHIEAELADGDNPTLGWRRVSDDGETVLRSPVSEAVDFTVFVGRAGDVVAAYRHLTGEVPLMPEWALGYIHCRERYHSQDELLTAANKFRQKQIPIGLIMQDWQYWGRYGWNAMRFDEHDYPSPALMTDSLHRMGIKLMLSVWARIDPQSEVGRQFVERGYFIPGTQWVDFFNPDAAALYWSNFSQRLLKPYHIDAWWQDATEPENDDLVGRRVWGGKYPGEVFRNVYPLLVNRTVYDGLRRDDPGRTPMILTRSGFSGMQRYGTAMWSGDVGNSWKTLRYQIAGGLGMAAAGMPWWTYDAGGFFRPADQYTNKDYQKRMLRWIQAAVYLPLMRAHGYMSNTEPWEYEPETERAFTECIRRRYRLMPYLKKANEDVHNGGTLMRPLVFDFPDDVEALKQSTEYMFGPSLLICPVTEPDIKRMRVYLPKNKKGWTRVATGERYVGGKYVEVEVADDDIPVFNDNAYPSPF